jgi:hypothetical protein
VKRFILTGATSSWDQYAEDYDTEAEAKRAACYWLDRGYDAQLFDNDTGSHSYLVYRYDGLGRS